jgi:hypothetical protein
VDGVETSLSLSDTMTGLEASVRVNTLFYARCLWIVMVKDESLYGFHQHHPGNSYGVLTPSVEYLWPMAAKEESQDIDLPKSVSSLSRATPRPLGPP